jgi:hypothetical protein
VIFSYLPRFFLPSLLVSVIALGIALVALGVRGRKDPS